MARVYNGKFSIVINTKNRVVLQKDDKGKFEAKDAQAAYNLMVEAAEKHGAELNCFQPEAIGNNPVVLTSRWGAPYMALLPDQDPAKTASKPRVIKVA